MGAELRVAGSRSRPRQAARVRVRRRRIESAERRTDVDRSRRRPGRFRLPLAQPRARVGQCLLSGCLRQQGVRVGQLSNGRRAGRDCTGLLSRAAVVDPGVWAAFQHGVHKDGYLYGFDGRNEPDASLACVDAASGEWCGAKRRKRSTAGPSSPSMGTFCVSASTGTCCGWISGRRKLREISRASLFLAPETWALPVLSRGLLYVTQNAQDGDADARQAAAALLRPARLRLDHFRKSTQTSVFSFRT